MIIKLLTFHKANNYGALLQCYALSKILNHFGHQVELINIKHRNDSTRIFDRIKLTFDLQQMDQFRKQYLPIQTKEYKNALELSENIPIADCYIVGSDQVWNPQITQNLFDIYFFNFLPKDVKKISFAASFGISEWSFPELQITINDLLSRFSAVGVRENDGIEICQNIFNLKATKTLDPTLLLNTYDDLLEKKQKLLKNTLVSYFFEKEKDHYLQLKIFSKSIGLKAVSLNDQRYHPGVKSIPLPSIQKWLSYIKNSEFVLTNSYHCMLFAIIFKRPFAVMPADINRMSRIKNLLEDLDLYDRYYLNFKHLLSSTKWMESINYAKVFRILENYKSESIKFLEDSINN